MRDLLAVLTGEPPAQAGIEDFDLTSRHLPQVLPLSLPSQTLAQPRKQQELGYVGALVLLNAEQSYQQTRISRIQAQAARFSDTATLVQALGGGWQSTADGTAPPVR